MKAYRHTRHYFVDLDGTPMKIIPRTDVGARYYRITRKAGRDWEAWFGLVMFVLTILGVICATM